MERLAIIDHERHQLFVEDVTEETLEKYGGEEEYIKATHTFKGGFSWDYITRTEYYPMKDYGVSIDFEELIG